MAVQGQLHISPESGICHRSPAIDTAMLFLSFLRCGLPWLSTRGLGNLAPSFAKKTCLLPSFLWLPCVLYMLHVKTVPKRVSQPVFQGSFRTMKYSFSALSLMAICNHLALWKPWLCFSAFHSALECALEEQRTRPVPRLCSATDVFFLAWITTTLQL